MSPLGIWDRGSRDARAGAGSQDAVHAVVPRVSHGYDGASGVRPPRLAESTPGAPFTLSGSTTDDFTLADEPFGLFRLWLDEAERTETNDPEAMTLATVDDRGLPDARMVLCKGVDASGLVFYTNAESVKGRQLAKDSQAAALFHWKSLRRQARFRGRIDEAPDAETDAYFASRPRMSRIGAWASQQSRPLESRAALEAAVAAIERRFGAGDIPRPAYWKGYRLTPVEIEFWRDGASRLHDRIVFRRAAPDQPWQKQRLFP
jgi:pyridoxamine 5'-phosphate oxidase